MPKKKLVIALTIMILALPSRAVEYCTFHRVNKNITVVPWENIHSITQVHKKKIYKVNLRSTVSLAGKAEVPNMFRAKYYVCPGLIVKYKSKKDWREK